MYLVREEMLISPLTFGLWLSGKMAPPVFGKRLIGICHHESSNQNSVVQMAKYQAPQRPEDTVMIQSEHTGAVDVLSTDLESADLLGDHRKGETFAVLSSRCLKDGGQMEGQTKV